MAGTRGWVVTLSLLVAGPASAAEFETWWGGHVGTGLQAVQGSGISTALSQVELNFRGRTGPWSIRVDLDYHVDPIAFSGGNPDLTFAPHYPLPPEWAAVQWKPNKFYLRMGVTNPDIGMQDWDERDNYLPTYTDGWTLQSGQNLGIEPGVELDDGTDLFAWAGYDMAWLTPSFGVGIQTEQDWFGTWTGLFYMPLYQYGMLFTSNEIYPASLLWISSEVNVGFAGPDLISGGQLVFVLFPDEMLGVAARVEAQFFPDSAAEHLEVDVNDFNFSGSLRADPTDWLHLAFEAKQSYPRNNGDPYFTGTFYVSVGTPGEAYENFDVYDPE